MSDPKIALIGYGNMGKFHARVLNKLGMLACIVEPSEKNNELARDRYNVPVYTKIDQIDDNTNAAVIAVPTQLHYKVLENVIQNKPSIKYFIVEKPLGINLDEAKHMQKMIQDNNKTVIVGHVEVYNPVITRFIEIINSGKYGNVRSFMIVRKGSVSVERLKSLSGVLVDIGVHDFDIISRFISGYCKLYCTGLTRNGSLNSAIVSIQNDNKFHGSIHLSREFAGKERKYIVECEDATINMDLIAQTITITGLKDAYGEYGSISIPHGAGSSIKVYGEPLQEEHLNFKNVISGKDKPIVSVSDGINALKIVDACNQSLESGRPVNITINN